MNIVLVFSEVVIVLLAFVVICGVSGVAIVHVVIVVVVVVICVVITFVVFWWFVWAFLLLKKAEKHELEVSEAYSICDIASLHILTKRYAS